MKCEDDKLKKALLELPVHNANDHLWKEIDKMLDNLSPESLAQKLSDLPIKKTEKIFCAKPDENSN
ncbi:hypothetical protein [Dyadobacter sp. CY356]|uniref:hypothetical protein n=1 Tax=Dyadobacter sp. CY356 TaxID=2906442 RepID=UPI001F3BF97D|nr:hypothetical protein [Dyadobacter sp. CY356]MCF0054905.1 hypothetical protein [Dyadobacter sp. CY356]